MMRQEDQERIEKYIQGNLSENETDNLWADFIADCELYGYFKTYLHLIALAKMSRGDLYFTGNFR